MKTLKSMSRVLLALLVLILVKASAVSAENTPGIQEWITYEYNETNGLPTGEANTVLQTKDGYVWIGSYGGLIRYDGTTFRNYSVEGAISSSSIRALFEDSKGRLWIGTNDVGVYLYEKGAFTQYQYAKAQEFLSVRSFAEGKDGSIYVGTTSGLAKVGEQELEMVDEKAHGMTIYSMAVDSNGVLWACIDDGIAMLISNGEVIGEFRSEELLEADLYCIDAASDGTLYLGTSGSVIYRLKLLNESYRNDSFSLKKYSIGELATVNDITPDADGNMWVAAMNGIGYLGVGGKWHMIAMEHTNSLNVVNLDYEGNVWIASSSYGIIHLMDGIYYNVNEKAEISKTAINTVAVSGDGYYLGTDTGLIVLDSNFCQVKNELTDLLEGERIRNILYDSQGKIWIGTYYEHGLVLYDPETGEITSYTQEDGLSDEQIRMVLECSDGRIAVATQSGVTILRNGEVVRTYLPEDGLTYPIILCLCEGEDGALYAGSDGQGFYEIKDDKVTHYGFDEGLDSGVVLRMLPDEGGAGMFISAGNSLYYWDFKTFRLLKNYDKSPGSIFDMCLVNDQLWLMQSNGINALNRDRLLAGEETSVQVIGIPEGLTGSLNANTWNAWKDGVYYICTSKGLSLLKLSELQTEKAPIKAIVNQVTADDTVYEVPEKIAIDGRTTRLTFDFAALTYTGQEIKVRYQLKGFDKDSYVITNDQLMSASYTNLSGGDYQFVLEVLGADGESVSSSCTVEIQKDYRFWEHIWFWVLVGIAAVLLIALLVWISIYAKTLRLKQRQAEYQSIIGQALRTFANTIDAKDKYTNGHSVRVAAYSLEIAKKLKLSKDEQERIYYIALLHDIGKIGISDNILNKPGKLTEEERKTIMSHPTIGGEILKDFTSLPGIGEGARYHHERYDGKGYNEGLKGEEIPFFARIIGVADSYDAMSGGRCYRKGMEADVVVEELKKGAGTQFDPKIVAVMLELIEEGKVPIELE